MLIGNNNNCNVYFTYTDSANTTFFNANGSTPFANYFWQITDGNTNVTTNVWGQNPAFNFSGPSTYHLVCVTVYDSITNCQATYCDSVLAGNNNCNVYFTYTDSANTTFFNANGSTPFANYFWQITDGNTNVTTNVWGQNPAFNFSGPSTYHLVCVTVYDSITNCQATYCDSVLAGNGSTGGSCVLNSVTLTLNHDNYAGETSWDIIDAAGNIVSSGASTAALNGLTTYEQLCLPTGCYTLNVYDSWGDGMCCAYGTGGYSLSDSVGNFYLSGGAFGSVDSRNFCVGGAINLCGNLSYTTINHIIGANGSVSFSSTTTGSVQPFAYDWSVNGTTMATTATPTLTLPNGVSTVCLSVLDTTGCVATVCDSILVNNANQGPQGCAGIVPDMTVVQDSLNPYQLYVQPILNNVPGNSSFIFYWSFGDNSGAFGSQSNHNYNGYGSYNLCYVAIDSLTGCIVNYCDTITLDSLGNFSRFINKPGFNVSTMAPILNINLEASTIETTAWEVNLYPNPAQQQINLTINTQDAINGQVRIVSATGQVVQQQVLDQAAGHNLLQLSVEQLPAGIYFVRLETAEQQQTLKFVKQ